MSNALKAILATLLVPAVPAQATTICYPRDQMENYIARDLQAQKWADGIVRPSSVMELWVSDEDGDWLMVTTDLNGNSCIVAYGERFSGAIHALPTGEKAQASY